MVQPVRTDTSLRIRFSLLALACTAALVALALVVDRLTGTGPDLAARGAVAFLVIAGVAMPGLAAHPFPVLGYANWVTVFRTALVALVAALLFEPRSAATAWTVVVVASVAAVMDGWDGWLARRSRQASAFGARFDMEVDALLILLLSIFVWRDGKAGGWVILSGALRYAFVAGGWVLPWLNEPLPPRVRRKAVCVVQIVGLIVAIGPIISPELSAAIAAATLALLVWSFGVDVAWLGKRAAVRVG